jgi:adenylate cyclase
LFEARLFFGRHCRREGKLLEAAELFEQAWQMRPDDYQSLVFLASIYSGLGRTAEAQATGRRCIAVIEKHLALHPDSARALYLGAIVWMQLNEPARATAWAERALAMDPDEPLTLYNVACFYALQKRTDQSLDVLERAVQHGFADQETMVHDADFDSLRGHPRFQALVDRLANS